MGDGPFDLVYVPGWVSNLDLMWDEPSYARFLDRLASFSRLILFDKRGTGLCAGVHTGEVEVSDGSVRWIAVQIGARVAALAWPGEVLVSRTVVDLVAGSGIAFEDRGEHELKGAPGAWRLSATSLGRPDRAGDAVG